MASSILSSIMSVLNSHEISNLSSRLGEPEQAVSSGVISSVATIIEGLAKKADDSSFMRQIFELVSAAPADLNVSSLASEALSSGGGSAAVTTIMDAGRKLLSMIFGSNQNEVSDLVARASAMSGGALRQIAALVAPLLLSVLGRRVREHGLTPSSLESELLGEAAGIEHLLPSGLSSVLGSVARPLGDVAQAATAEAQQTARPSRGLWPVLGVVAVLLGIFWVINNYSGASVDTAQARRTASETGERMRSAVSGLGDFVVRKLPGNVDLRIPKYGVEGRLLSFIQASAPASTETWFDFDRIGFDTNSATLRPDSQEQLQNIATILKAYLNVRVKIGGYTDNTGDDDENLELSQARAHVVTGELTRLGIANSRLQAEGYGEQHPVADNSTAEGRAKNRRISIRVTEK